MTQHDVDAVAFPRLDEAQLAILDRCPLTKRGRHEDGESLFEAGRPRLQVLRRQVGPGRDRGRVRRRATDDRGPRARRVHRRRGPGDRRPGGRRRRRPGRCGGLRGVDRRPAADPQPATRTWATSSCRRSSPAGSSCASRRPHDGPARDRLPPLAGHLPGPRLPGQEPGAVHLAGPGGRPAGEATARAVRADGGGHSRGRLGPQAAACATPPNRELAEALGLRRPLEPEGATTWSWSGPGRPGWPPPCTGPRRG